MILALVLILSSIIAPSVISQEMANRTDTVICYDISHSGFVEVDETTFENIFFSLRKNAIFTTPYSVNISGIVQSIPSESARILDVTGTETALPIMGIENIDSTNNKLTRFIVISIKNPKISNSQKSDSLILYKINPQRVYVPKSLDISPGDYISITNYAAILNDTCYIGEDSRQKALVFGKFRSH